MSWGLRRWPDGSRSWSVLHVVSDLEHVLTGSDGAHHLDSRVVDRLGVFDHDHGVRAVREHSAGVHLGDVAPA